MLPGASPRRPGARFPLSTLPQPCAPAGALQPLQAHRREKQPTHDPAPPNGFWSPNPPRGLEPLPVFRTADIDQRGNHKFGLGSSGMQLPDGVDDRCPGAELVINQDDRGGACQDIRDVEASGVTWRVSVPPRRNE